MFIKIPAVGNIQELIINSDFIVSVTLDSSKNAGVLEIELVKGDRTQVIEYYFEDETDMNRMYERLENLLQTKQLYPFVPAI